MKIQYQDVRSHEKKDFDVSCGVVLSYYALLQLIRPWYPYELKKRCMIIEEQVERLLQNGKPAKVSKVKGSSGDTTKPDFEK